MPASGIQRSMMRLMRPWIGTCAETGDHLSDHIDHTLEPAQERRVRRHLEWCSHCRALYASLARTVERVRKLGEDDPVPVPPSVAATVIDRIRRDAS